MVSLFKKRRGGYVRIQKKPLHLIKQKSPMMCIKQSSYIELKVLSALTKKSPSYFVRISLRYATMYKIETPAVSRFDKIQKRFILTPYQDSYLRELQSEGVNISEYLSSVLIVGIARLKEKYKEKI